MPTPSSRDRTAVAAYLGVDPGASGGLAMITLDLDVGAVPMPSTPADLWAWLGGWVGVPRPFAVIEKVGGYVRDGGGNIGSAMFKFGVSYGTLLMGLTAAGVPYEEVTPGVWQKGLGIAPKKPHTKTRKVQVTKGKNKGKWRDQRYGGESDTEWKNRLKAKAQALFPGVTVTLATADALLIAEYCRRKREGRL